MTNLGLVAFLLIKHFCAHKLYTTVKVNSAVHYKSMQLLMREKTNYIVWTLINTYKISNLLKQSQFCQVDLQHIYDLQHFYDLAEI